MKRWWMSLGVAGGAALAMALSPAGEPTDPSLAIDAEGLLAHIRVLASDEFEGRAPATPGEDKTIDYLTAQFRRLGLAPGNPDGTYVQAVPLVGFTNTPRATFTAGGRTIEPRYPDQYVANTRRAAETHVAVDASPIVFVGYGVVAPEYQWDDFKDVDVRGKTIVMLVNDPQVPDPANPSRLDDQLFQGRAMTYYGRWTYKYEIASVKGAAAAVIVHETDTAGYPWSVVSGSWSREQFDIERPDNNAGRVPVESWITVELAREVFAAAGRDFDELKRAALRRDFRPVELDARATFHIENRVRRVRSRNAIAKLEGSDPRLKDEYLVYTAHWDHLGKDETLAGDQVYNGAVDNASGVATLLEIAEAFARLPAPPRRSILFLAVTAEEKGLLGAKYYAENPLYPLRRTVANINIDGANPWGRTRDVVVVGMGQSTLEETLAEAAQRQGRVLKPDQEPEKGFYYRSDHFEFAKQGVPALYIDSGVDFIDKPEGYGMRKREEFTANDYHKVSDEIKPDWDLAGAVEDARLLFDVGLRTANADQWPQWKPGSEFKARRDAMLREPQH